MFDSSKLIITIVIIAVLWIISGILCMNLHAKKGYKGGFLIGFFLGVIGLIYSAGLPDLLSRNNNNNTNKE